MSVPAMRTLLIDNYDSYTYNLLQLIAEVTGEVPTVLRNDELDWPSLHQRLAAGEFHNVVISPGPGTPSRPSDIGVCLPLLQAGLPLPVLGICLGFQALATANGGAVGHAPEPVHGRLSAVEHAGHALFRGIPSGPELQVVRYHSLEVAEASLPACLEPLAWTAGGHHALRHAAGGSDEGGGAPAREQRRVLMALRHRALPQYGVQFHPESIGSTYGAALLRNFGELSAAFHGLAPPARALPFPERGPPGRPLPPREWAASGGSLDVCHRALPGLLEAAGGSESLFWSLFGGGNSPPEAAGGEDTFWLDSAAADRGRFSFMGGRGGPLWRRILYKLAPLSSGGGGGGSAAGTLTVTTADGREEVLRTQLWPWLEAQLRERRCNVSAAAAGALPFDFWGGFVGYLGYELKAECGSRNVHESGLPDAALFLADRLVAIDHSTRVVHVVALHEATGSGGAEARRWVDDTALSIEALAAAGAPCGVPSPVQPPANGHAAAPGPFRLREGRQAYLENIAGCMKALHDGESYEVCLTTVLSRDRPPDPRQLYSTLRRVNPAPYAAWLSFGGCPPGPLSICCSSPERFLRGGRGGALEAKPIKGTAPRGPPGDDAADAASAAALSSSEKDQAENLMIVDLLRNDLGRVCAPGSVHVPALMALESYATVHQLVSTVAGLRREDVGIVDCLRAAFPGGSMTGAPKLRTMEIIDRLEGGPRGVYSGSIGFISLNGTFDLNIVIRTAVLHAGRVSIGAGGAVVVQSDPGAEFDEMRLKAQALLRAVGACDAGAGGGGDPATLDEG